MLSQVAPGVLVHESRFCQTNTVVVEGPTGVLLIDPGVHDDELACLATDLSNSGRTVVAGFSTHPHWDHLLWHPALGAAPRYGTARCAATAQARLSGDIQAVAKAAGIPDQVPLDLIGHITPLPADTTQFPWDGPQIRILEHQAHAPGHATLLLEEQGVLIAGDMLSDVLIPMLNPTAPTLIDDYLSALAEIERVAATADVLIPGHGSTARANDLQTDTGVRQLLQ